MSQEFPKLMWYADGREITVHSQSEQDEKLADGASLTREPIDVTGLQSPLEGNAEPSASEPIVYEDEIEDEAEEVSDEAEASTAAPKKKRGKK